MYDPEMGNIALRCFSTFIKREATMKDWEEKRFRILENICGECSPESIVKSAYFVDSIAATVRQVDMGFYDSKDTVMGDEEKCLIAFYFFRNTIAEDLNEHISFGKNVKERMESLIGPIVQIVTKDAEVDPKKALRFIYSIFDDITERLKKYGW